jgi:hypothetical protein
VQVIAGVDARLQVLAAVLDPLHRPSGLDREPRDQHLLPVDAALDAESAPDVGGNHPETVLRPGKLRGRVAAHHVGQLRRRIEGQLAAGGVKEGEAAAVLHRHARVAVGPEPAADDQVRVVLGGLQVAVPAHPADEHVVAPARVQARRVVGQGALDRQDRLQDLVLHVQQLRRVLGHVGVVGQDRRHGLTGEAHHVHGQAGLEGVLRAGLADVRPYAQVGAVPAREDRGVGERLVQPCRIDLNDARVRVRAAHQHEVQAPRHLQVVEIARGAGRKPPVLDPPDSGADQAGVQFEIRAHRPPSSRRRRAAVLTAVTMFV